MRFDITLIKRHPVATGAIVIIGGLIVFLLLRRGHPTAGAATDSSGGADDFAMAQLDAATNVQLSQIDAPVRAAQIQANVADNQTAAQLAAVQLTTAAQVEQTRIAANVDITKNATDDATQIALDNITTQQQVNMESAQLQDDQIKSNTTLGVASLEAGVLTDQIDSQTAITEQELYNQSTLENSVVAQAGKDKGRSSLGWGVIISALLGQGAQAVAAAEPAAVASEEGSSPASIIGGIANTIGTIGKTFFA